MYQRSTRHGLCRKDEEQSHVVVRTVASFSPLRKRGRGALKIATNCWRMLLRTVLTLSDTASEASAASNDRASEYGKRRSGWEEKRGKSGTLGNNGSTQGKRRRTQVKHAAAGVYYCSHKGLILYRIVCC